MAKKEKDPPVPRLDEHQQLLCNEVQLAFGQNLRAIRGDQALTLEDVAGLTGLHANYVGAVERGERNLTLFNVWRLANALGVTVAELAGTLPLRKVRRVGR